MRTALILVLAGIAGLAAPHLFYPMLLMKLLCFGMFACALNLVLGYGGLLSLGHAAFFGGAGYATGYALLRLALPFEAALALGVFVSGLLGYGFALLATRRQGIYFGMITLALAQLVYFVIVQWGDLGGEDGMQSIPRGSLFGLFDLTSDRTMYYVVAVLFGASMWLTRRIVHSPFGQVVIALRDNSARTTSLGFDVDSYRRLLFVLSAMLAGLAGGLKASVFGVVTLSDVSWHLSGAVVLMVLLGGLGTHWGPVIGAWLVVLLENEVGEVGTHLARISGIEWFSGLGESVSLLTGAIFVACVLMFRRGIVGELSHWWTTHRHEWTSEQVSQPEATQFVPIPPP